MLNSFKIRVAASAFGLLLVLTGCSTVGASPDVVGVYYAKGDIDGYKFQECIAPGAAGPYTWNDEVIWLPVSQKSWLIKEHGGDTDEATVVSSKPEENQPSGVQVKVWSQTRFYLNTFCDENGGKVKPFWEKLGRAAGADGEDGFRKMIIDTLVPSLEKAARDIIRSYGADALVGNVNGINTEVQDKIAAVFTTELKRMTGDDFFCGPSFTRLVNECPPISFSIIDVDYADAGIQAARNEKQKNIELAAAAVAKAEGEAKALVAQAQGQVDAAKKLEALYKSPGWVKLQAQILAGKALTDACAAAKECRIITGSDGTLIMS